MANIEWKCGSNINLLGIKFHIKLINYSTGAGVRVEAAPVLTGS
jgi:hypothetical protein